MPAHIHAELMKQYAEDALTTDKPWELWECKGPKSNEWDNLRIGPTWYECHQYRRKPRTININGHEVPEPMREKPPYGAYYWVADLRYEVSPVQYVWEAHESDKKWLRAGLCHSTKEAAEAHARALLSFTQIKD